MKILAVSDVQIKSLEEIIAKTPQNYSDIQFIISCGDLEADYLENIVESLGKELVFVSGNHVFRDEKGTEDEVSDLWEKSRVFNERSRPCIAGYEDLHGKIKVTGDYILAGFGGSMWYNGKENQFKEKEMREIVEKVSRKVSSIRFFEKLLLKRKKELIVLTHAPPAGIHDNGDPCHKGFECFKKLIQVHSPALWLHGHVHPQGNGKPQITILDKTTVVNVYGCKIIDINGKDVSVKHHC